MADEEEDMADVTYSAEQVERLLCCSVCLDRYTNPRILPCQHTFCKSPCLENLVDLHNRRVKCPECRKEHYVPPSGAAGFPPNITIANFLDLPTQRGSNAPGEEGHGDRTISVAGSANKCGVCESESQTTKCFHCNKMVCDSCKRSHVGQMKMDISRLLNQIRRGIPKLSNSISSVEQKSEQARQQVEQVKSEVTEQIDKYIGELKDRQRLLHSELDTVLQGELRSLRLHQENLEVELASMSSYCDSTETLVNQPELDMPEADLVNLRRQCVEYMEQLRHTETNALPSARPVRFRHNGRTLHQSISTFGEAVVDDPSERRVNIPANVSSFPSRTNDTNQSRRRRWENSPSIDRSFFDTMRASPVPSPTPSQHSRRTLSPPAHWQATQESTSDPRATRSSTDYRAHLGYDRHSNALNGRPPARISDYMFAMDSIPDELLFDVSYLGESTPAPRGRAGGRTGRNPVSYFARERNGDRMAALIGGGIAGGTGYPSNGFTHENVNNNTNNDHLRRQSRPPLPPNPAPRPQRDPRPTEYYEVDMDGNFNLVTLPENTPLRGRRGRGREIIRSDSDRGGNAGSDAEAQRTNEPMDTSTIDQEESPNQTNNSLRSNSTSHQGNSENVNGSSEQVAGGSGEGNNNIASGARNANSSDSNTEGESRTMQRSSTFVREGGPQSDSNTVPRVSDSGVQFDIPLNRTMDAEEMNALIQQAASSLTTERPLINYQGKGQPVQKIGGDRGSAEGRFKLPRGVALSSFNDSIVVADSSNHRVQMFDCNGQFIKSFGSYGDGDGEFDCLAGAAVAHSTGDIVIADRYNHRIQIFDRYGQFVRKFGHEGSGNGQLKYPWGVAVDVNGLIYVCDKENHRIQVFGSDGTFLRKFGGLGNNPGQMENPYYVAATSDNKIVVSDTGNHRIQVFNNQGRHLQSFGSQGSENGRLKSPKGVAVDQEGFIIVSDSGNHRVQVFRGDGRFYCKFGTKGRGDGQFKEPEGIALTSSGKIVVTDKDNYRIQIF